MIGEKGIYDELNEVGIKCHGLEDNDVTDVAALGRLDPSITSVVVGLDTHVNYVKLSRAASYIRDRHCLFLATNTDASDPTDNGLIVGAAGRRIRCMGRRLDGERGKRDLREAAGRGAGEAEPRFRGHRACSRRVAGQLGHSDGGGPAGHGHGAGAGGGFFRGVTRRTV